MKKKEKETTPEDYVIAKGLHVIMLPCVCVIGNNVMCVNIFMHTSDAYFRCV